MARDLSDMDGLMAAVEADGARLLTIERTVDWNALAVAGPAIGRDPEGIVKRGRKPWSLVLMIKVLILQALHNLSDEAMEKHLRRDLLFRRFVGLEQFEDAPDARTVWLYRENLATANVLDDLFIFFNGMIDAAGFKAAGGQMIDATFVEVPRQRNSKDDNDDIKGGGTPTDWSDKKRAHKDVDAAWTKKGRETHFGYKNHANVDAEHKIIREFEVTPANEHDSQVFEEILTPAQDGEGGDRVFADSAYRSEAAEEMLEKKGLDSKVCERAYRNKPLTDEQKAANKEKSRIRVRCEHVFGHIATSMNGCFVRVVGLDRATAKITLEVLAYNMSRLAFLVGTRSRANATGLSA